MATEHVTLGNALIAIHNPTFFEGYTSGYLRYAHSDAQRPLTDGSIKQLFDRQFTAHSEIWRAGFCMGWLTAMHGLPRIRHLCKPVRYRGQQQQSQKGGQA